MGKNNDEQTCLQSYFIGYGADSWILQRAFVEWGNSSGIEFQVKDYTLILLGGCVSRVGGLDRCCKAHVVSFSWDLWVLVESDCIRSNQTVSCEALWI